MGCRAYGVGRKVFGFTVLGLVQTAPLRMSVCGSKKWTTWVEVGSKKKKTRIGSKLGPRIHPLTCGLGRGGEEEQGRGGKGGRGRGKKGWGREMGRGLFCVKVGEEERVRFFLWPSGQIYAPTDLLKRSSIMCW